MQHNIDRMLKIDATRSGAIITLGGGSSSVRRRCVCLRQMVIRNGNDSINDSLNSSNDSLIVAYNLMYRFVCIYIYIYICLLFIFLNTYFL